MKRMKKLDLLKKYIDIFEDFQYIKTDFCFDIMNTETKKLQYTLTEKIEEDISILSESLGEVSQYLLAISRGRMCGMETVFVL